MFQKKNVLVRFISIIIAVSMLLGNAKDVLALRVTATQGIQGIEGAIKGDILKGRGGIITITPQGGRFSLTELIDFVLLRNEIDPTQFWNFYAIEVRDFDGAVINNPHLNSKAKDIKAAEIEIIPKMLGGSQQASWILDYPADPASEDPQYAGGKCAKLAHAARRELPNPMGYNITAEAVREYYRHNLKLIEMIEKARNLDVTDVRARNAASKEIQDFMRNHTNLPPALLKLIQDYYTEKCKEISKQRGYKKWRYVPFAFRGSGIMEDAEGEIPWFSKSIGAQPGQGTTILNVIGPEAVEAAVIEVIAGLFNDQIFVYRDVQIFFDFVSKMKDVVEYNKLIELAEKHGFDKIAAKLKNEKSPGYMNLSKLLEVIADKEPEIEAQYNWKERLRKSIDSNLDPMSLVTGVAALEMVHRQLGSGTAFTSHPGSGFDGSTYARATGSFPAKQGDDFSGYTRYVKINFGYGLGPGIVEGKFQPNIVTLFDVTGKRDWVPMEFMVGKKEMRLLYLEKAIETISHKFSEERVRRLAALYEEWQDPSKEGQVRQALKSEFNIQDADIWVRAMMDLWFYLDRPEKYKATAEEKAALLKQLGLTSEEFFTLSYLVKHINKVKTDSDTTSYVLNNPEMSASRFLSYEALTKLADMIAEVGDINAKERLEAGDPNWRERRDVEFAIAQCEENDASPYKAKVDHIYDPVTGEDMGPGWVKIVHLQNRPINPEKEVQDADNIIFKKKRIDKKYIKAKDIKPAASGGLVGYGAENGVLYVVDPYKSLAEQEEEVGNLKDEGKSVIVVLEEMGPEHDPIVETAGAAIVWRGNDTSHAYIFSLEQRIPIVISPTVDERYKKDIAHGKRVTISGEDGEIYSGDIPLLDDDLKIRIDMLPSTKAGIIVSTLQSAQEIARLGSRSALIRIEFIINQLVKIYPQGAHAYDLMVALDKGEKKEADLTTEELSDIKELRADPAEIAKVKETIAGFPSAAEFITEQMRYASNILGPIFPLGNYIRAYDNKEKEALLYGLITAKLFLRYDDTNPAYDSPLTGQRGSQLMIHPHLKKGFQALNRGILRSIKDGFRNNSFFFVYLRSEDELRIQLEDFEKLCEEEGVYPEKIGTMIELGHNALNIDKILDMLNEFLKKHEKNGMKKVYISFGTNDLTNSLGMTSREDRDFTGNLLVLHPALINVSPEKGRIEIEQNVAYGPKEQGEPYIITINDESAPVVMRVIRHIASRAKAKGVDTSLCGQAITLSIDKGNIEAGMETISLLDTFGTQTNKITSAAMMEYDAKAHLTQLSQGAADNAAVIAGLSEISKAIKKAVVVGEAVFINKPEDILALRGGDKQKIAIVVNNIGTREELDKANIPWDYLKYAGAILVGDAVTDLGILDEDVEVKRRVKAKIQADNISAEINTGDFITLDFAQEKVYKGKLSTEVIDPPFAEMRMPAKGLIPETKNIARISASDLFESKPGEPAAIDIHPLAFAIYKSNPSELSGKVRTSIKNLIGDKDPLEYLQARISDYVLEEAKEALDNGLTPVYTVFRLTRNQLRLLQGGEAIEKTKGKEGINFDDPYHRLQGGARAISDFWQIFDLEIDAYKAAKTQYPDLALQLSTKGTRIQEVLEMQLRILGSNGIMRDTHEIGLELTSSGEVYIVEDLIKQGIKFFSYDTKTFVSAVLSSNLDHPDVFTIEGKDRMKKWALEKALDRVRGISAEDGAWFGLNLMQVSELRDDLVNSEAVVNDAFSADEVMNAIPADHGPAAVVINSAVLRKNVGFIKLLRQLKDKSVTIAMVASAEDSELLSKLGISGLADITTDRLDLALIEVEKKGISSGNVGIIDKPAIAQFETFYQGLSAEGYHVYFMPETKIEEGSIHVSSFIIGKLLRDIFDDVQLTEKFESMVAHYRDTKQIAGKDYENFTAASSGPATVSLVKVSDNIAEAARIYQNTVEQVARMK